MQSNRRGGFIHLIVLIIIVVIILGFFGFNLQQILESDGVQTNLSYLWSLAKTLWNNYLGAPFIWIWEHLLQPILGDNTGDFFNNIKEGQGSAAPETPSVAY
jgi:hypothetical protein